MSALKLSEFFALSPEEREAALQEFIDTPPNGEADQLRRAIAAFESRYEMSSADMRAKLEANELRETFDIGEWYMLLKVQAGEQ